MTTNHTDAEQAFIDASVPVHDAADKVRAAIERHADLTNKAFSLGLERLGDKMEDAEYVHDLLVAAAHQAGFGDDSFIVKGLNATLQEYRGFQAAQEALPQPTPDDGLVM